MVKITAHVRYFLMIAVFTAGVGGVFSVFAQDGGYEGLIAPAAPPESAPAKKETPPPGYAGVVPGYVAKEDSGFSKKPGQNGPLTPKTSEDIKLLSQIHGGKKQMPPEQPLSTAPLDKFVIAAYEGPRKNGMLVTEYATKRNVERMMERVRDKTLSPSERKETAREVYEKLFRKAKSLQSRRSVPDYMYRMEGMPDVYIRAKKEGYDGALARVDSAMKELRKYQ